MAKDAKKKEVVAEEAQTAAAATLSTKSAMMSGILQAMSTMSHEQMMQWFPDAMALASSIGNGQAAQNQASIAMKGTPIKEDVTALFEGEELAEEAKDKLVTLIEHAVSLQTTILREELEESYRVKLIEEAVKIQEQMIEKIDSYATYAAEQWVEENSVAIDNTIKLRKADKLLEGLTQLFQEIGYEVPDEKVDLLAQMESEIAELNQKLNDQVAETVQMREKLVAQTALGIFDAVSEGLTEIETDKFKKLVEDIDVDVDPADLEKKLRIIREAHFKPTEKKDPARALAESMTRPRPETHIETEDGKVITEETLVEDKKVDPLIERYATAISRMSNRYGRR